MHDIGKIPPQAIDLEEAILGALMLENKAIEEVFLLLKPQYFYKEQHQFIYKAIARLYSDNQPIDLFTVEESLRKENKLEQVGGPYYITQLTLKVASAAHIEYHALIIKQQFMRREYISFAGKLINMAFEDNDIDQIIEFSSSENDKIINNEIASSTRETSLSSLTKCALHDLDERIKLFNQGKVTGILTPVKKLTIVTNGWQPGNLIIIAGRPSMGKTAFILSALRSAANYDEYPCLFSLEMDSVRLVDRLICGEANVMAERYKAGCLGNDELIRINVAAGKIHKLNAYIDDNAICSMEYIKNRCRVLHRKDECSLIIIDYLQLIEPEKSKNKLREQEVSEISRKAKLLGKELQVPVILLAQLNRSCETRAEKRPMLSDLRESGGIEQDADLVIFLYRAEYYGIENDDKGPTKGRGELIISKHRNGPICTVPFGYNESMTQIHDYVNPNDIPKDLLNDKEESPY